MIRLPDRYKERITAMFGQQGVQWLESVPFIIKKYIKRFGLTKIKLLDDLTFNIVLFANCREFGEVVLKIGLPYNELLIRETIALENFSGVGACKCYYSNIDDGIILLERLLPGETLHKINEREERIKAFCEVAQKLNKKADKAIDLPTYREILNRSIQKSKQEKEMFRNIKALIDIADNIYGEIEIMNLDKYILHADLHHSNILTSGNSMKAIDPHGFIGEHVMETSRFIENEIQKQPLNEKNIVEVIDMVANCYKEDRQMVCKALFVDYVLSTCWDIELNFDEKHVYEDIQNLKIILECLKSMI